MPQLLFMVTTIQLLVLILFLSRLMMVGSSWMKASEFGKKLTFLVPMCYQ